MPDIFPALYINNTIVKNNEAAKQVIEEKKLSPKIEIGIKTTADIEPITKGNIQSKIVKFLVLLAIIKVSINAIIKNTKP